MNIKQNSIVLLISILPILACNGQKEQEVEQKPAIDMNNPTDKFSYALGVNITQQFKQQGITDVNPEAFAKAVEDVLKANPLLVSKNEAANVISQHLAKNRPPPQRQPQPQGGGEAELAQKNLAEAKTFLEENGKKDGIITTASGLQYKIINEGSGPKPGPTDMVTTHYHGTVIDGTVFDSSVDKGQPSSFPINRVIAGWTEALQLMSTGSKWVLYIPPELAYGPRRRNEVIGPNSLLIFELELLGINQ